MWNIYLFFSLEEGNNVIDIDAVINSGKSLKTGGKF